MTDNRGFLLRERTQMVDIHPFIIRNVSIKQIDEDDAYFYRVKVEGIFDDGISAHAKKEIVLASNDSIKVVREIRELDNKIATLWEERKKLYNKLESMSMENCETKNDGVKRLDSFACEEPAQEPKNRPEGFTRGEENR